MCDVSREIQRVFAELNKDGIEYCHWKSNAHLAESFASKRDFDLLVAQNDAGCLRDCLKRLGLKRRHCTQDKAYPGMEDYLGFDAQTGNLFHLHVHFQLVFGRKLDKNYRLPIEREILATATDDEIYPIKRICPELELIVLVLRSILKLRLGLSPAVKSLLGAAKFPKNIVSEFDYLVRRIDEETFRTYVLKHFPSLMHVFTRLAKGNINSLSYRQLKQFHVSVVEALAAYRQVTGEQLETQRQLRRQAANRSKTWLGGGGTSVAFVGADGAGKSSTVVEMERWLGWKLSVASAYMGIPKDDFRLAMLQQLKRAVETARFHALVGILDRLRWVHVAKRRYQTYWHSENLKKQDYVVIFDRFPLKEFREMDEPMDGPRIREPPDWKRVEQSFYDRIPYPDIIFVLQVTEEESVRRKKVSTNGQSGRKQLAHKVAAVNRLVENGNGRFISVNTVHGREQTLLEMKRKLWEKL